MVIEKEILVPPYMGESQPILDGKDTKILLLENFIFLKFDYRYKSKFWDEGLAITKEEEEYYYSDIYLDLNHVEMIQRGEVRHYLDKDQSDYIPATIIRMSSGNEIYIRFRDPIQSAELTSKLINHHFKFRKNGK